MEIKDQVFNTFKTSEKPLKAAEVAEITGADKKEVDKAIKILKKEEVIYSPKVCYYTAK
ncbi:MAG: MarR family transcriptional regulator [Bacteroidetes bacterium]|nr:MarR family transcriptional regulator [Bacteroidota bacterium]MBL6962747.1 MarR family transcriptional regulator [Bacteroidota bacterium]